MVTEYFDDDANFARLMFEIQSWKGTKHAHRDVCIKGSFVNCARWADAVLTNVGAIPPVTFPPYVTRHGGRDLLRVLIDTLDGAEGLERVWKAGDDAPAPPPKRGRLLVISSGEAVHHLAIIATSPVVWHCLNEVEEGNYFDTNVRNHLFAVYRAVVPAK